MTKSIPHNLPLENGRFSFYSGLDRIESGIDFVMSSYAVVREYNDEFSTRFLWELVQAPTSLLVSAQSAFLLRFSSLLTSAIPHLDVDSSTFNPVISGDRKVNEFALSYRNTEPESPSPTPNLFVRFL